MADVEFTDNTIRVLNTMNDRVNAALEECAGELESRVKRNTRVDTGQTKNSWRHRVDTNAHTAVIGSDNENTIWEEFGTGEYALQGNGRRGGWSYKDVRGVWHFTRGKKPSRAFYNAYASLKNKLIKRIQDSLKGL